jgi:hypothetical protein
MLRSALISEIAGRPLILKVGDFPFVVGEGPGGVDSPCPRCSAVLLQSVSPNSVYDVAFRCSHCGLIACAPDFPPGRGLGGVLHVLAPGPRQVTESFVADMDQVLVGLPAVERRGKECGLPRPAAQRVVLDSAGIRSVVAEAKDLFEGVLTGFQGSRVSKHRLVLLISEAERNADAIDDGSREIEVISVMQLKRCCDLFARWRLDPLYDALIRASKNPPEFVHNQLVLEIAGTFADSGLGPELVEPHLDNRQPDLRLRVSARWAVEIDIKAPLALQRHPGIEVPATTAKKLIAKVIRSSRGQFSAPSILVVAGAFLAGDAQALEQSTHAALTRALRREATPLARLHHESLLGVLLLSTAVRADRTRGSGPFSGSWDEVDWRSHADLRWIPNPQYALDLNLSFTADMSEYDISFKRPGA